MTQISTQSRPRLRELCRGYTEWPAGAPAARAALLTVDDDPGVSRAVARDLRRRYGEKYRIVRAESGQSALEALREMKLRGDEVAVLLADYRMPQMSGIEFLEQAMDLYPWARRVLLTAYADTGAAIDAINVVDLDHYLLKPWDPPEEKFYPVVDAQLDAWLSSDRKPVSEIKVVGHRWNARSSGVREFLARNQIPYHWYSSDEPEAARLLAAAGVDALRLPVVIAPDGAVSVEPTDTELAAAVGLTTSPIGDFYDIVVIGGGPAGLGAAVYGASEGLRTVLVERTATGGQAGQSSRIENYLGFPDGVSGSQLTDRARRQATKFGAELITTRDVVEPRGHRIVTGGPVRRWRLDRGAHGHPGHWRLLPPARRTRPRRLDRPRRLLRFGSHRGAELRGPGRVYRGRGELRRPGRRLPGQDGEVGDHRGAGESLAASMSYYLIQQIEGIDNIKVRARTEVVEAHGSDHLERLTLCNCDTGETETIDAGWLFIFAGATPHTDWLEGVVVRDDHGFVLAGPDLSVEGRPPGWTLERAPYHLETSVPGVFVAGDARAESAKRVASAVGEGAMAVMFVHRYLQKL